MTPADLSRTVAHAVRGAVGDGELPAGVELPQRVVVDRTRPGGVGEYATAVAFPLAKSAGRPPGDVARVLARRLAGAPGIDRVEVTGSGFLNFVMGRPSAEALVRDVRERGLRYGVSPEVAPGVVGARTRAEVVRDAVLRLGGDLGLNPDLDPDTRGPRIAPVPKKEGDVFADYGADAARWAMLAVPPHETPSFSGRLLVQDESNEFFRVRYARARARALLRNAAHLGFRPEAGDEPGDTEHTPAADALLRALADHPLALEAAAHHRAPERLARQLVRLADALLDFQYDVLPKGDEKPSAAHRARLALAEAAGTVLAGGLSQLGIAAPERL
ncbi:ArgS-related anticodon-binding protein NrtL [Streptomyces sp. NPDC058279]|uniref:ArgS-related anticodon-binding protein NrtL n=1 Tax=Streptomyces sp. NPDC058279 TaxID=3346418 RepID=UPI0036F01D83